MIYLERFGNPKFAETERLQLSGASESGGWVVGFFFFQRMRSGFMLGSVQPAMPRSERTAWMSQFCAWLRAIGRRRPAVGPCHGSRLLRATLLLARIWRTRIGDQCGVVRLVEWWSYTVCFSVCTRKWPASDMWGQGAVPYRSRVQTLVCGAEPCNLLHIPPLCQRFDINIPYYLFFIFLGLKAAFIKFQHSLEYK